MSLNLVKAANNSSEVNQVELDELKQKLSDETKTREKLLQVTRTKIQTYREVVSQVLGYDVSSSDGSTYKFLSIYAQERSDAVVSLIGPFPTFKKHSIYRRLQKTKMG